MKEALDLLVVASSFYCNVVALIRNRCNNWAELSIWLNVTMIPWRENERLMIKTKTTKDQSSKSDFDKQSLCSRLETEFQVIHRILRLITSSAKTPGSKIHTFWARACLSTRCTHLSKHQFVFRLRLLPFSNGRAVSSTSPPVRYLDDPWLFFCFFLSDLLANGSIRSTIVLPDDMFDDEFGL